MADARALTLGIGLAVEPPACRCTHPLPIAATELAAHAVPTCRQCGQPLREPDPWPTGIAARGRPGTGVPCVDPELGSRCSWQTCGMCGSCT